MRKILTAIIGLFLVLWSVSPGSAEILYQNNFNGGNLDDWTHITTQNPFGETGEWIVEDGVLQFTKDSDNPQGGSFRLDILTLPESYMVEYDVRSVEIGPGASHTANYTHWVHWYLFVGHGYRSDRTYINASGYPFPPLQQYNPLELGLTDSTNWHHMKYVEDGTSYSLYMDGVHMYTVNSPSPISGGNFVLWANPGIHQFDNLVITTLPEPSAKPPRKPGNPGLPGCLAEVEQLRSQALVPQTGQSIPDVDYDDGYYQMGVSWSPETRFTDNGDGTVTDNLTRLVWTKNAQQVPGEPSWDDALTACKDLNLADYDDWRLPNARELHSLIDLGRHSPALPEGHPFTGVVNALYWTSTTYAQNPIYAWCVNIGNGRWWPSGDKEYYWGYRVWPVRGGN